MVTFIWGLQVELYRNDQHRFKIVVDGDNEVDLMVQTQHMRDLVILVIRGLAQKFNSTSLNSLLRIEAWKHDIPDNVNQSGTNVVQYRCCNLLVCSVYFVGFVASACVWSSFSCLSMPCRYNIRSYCWWSIIPHYHSDVRMGIQCALKYYRHGVCNLTTWRCITHFIFTRLAKRPVRCNGRKNINDIPTE